jgi:hypothetical protein
MIICISLLLLGIYNVVNADKIDSNVFNLFHKQNAFYALLLFSIEGIFYLLTAYFRKNTKCTNLKDILIFMGIYNILLGISLYLMRITNFFTYLLIFYMIMSIIIITIIIKDLY